MAKSNKGWIKLYRKSVDNPLYNAEPFDRWHAWQDLLLMANHESKDIIYRGMTIHVKAGEVLTSMQKLAERWQWSVNKVRRYIRQLSDSGMCHSVGTANGTTISLTNWALYQDGGRTDGTANGTTLGTAHGTANGTLTRINKNNKEYKNARARAADQESKKGIRRNQDLDAWLKQQTMRRVESGN